MTPHHEIPDEARGTMGHGEMDFNADAWQRWDEDLVEEFGLWLSRIAKAFAIVLLAGFAVVATRWFWNMF